MAYRDRIVEVRTVPASSIVPQDVNPNLHDEQQKTSLRAALDRRGVTGIPIVVERQGKLRMIDGHLRREVLGDQPVRVAVLDLTEKEEREEVIAHDQIARLAQVDPTAQLELVEGTEPEALESLGLTLEAVEALRLETTVPNFEPVSEDEQGRLDELAPIMVACPECGHEFNAREAGTAA